MFVFCDVLENRRIDEHEAVDGDIVFASFMLVIPHQEGQIPPDTYDRLFSMLSTAGTHFEFAREMCGDIQRKSCPVVLTFVMIDEVLHEFRALTLMTDRHMSDSTMV